jgi:spermidine synthase
MPRPWQTIDNIETLEGRLELRKRGEKDFLITVGGRILMNSRTHRSETELGLVACGHLKKTMRSQVLIGGLGMGFTLKAVLSVLPKDAKVIVGELNPVVVEWCRGPLADLTDNSVADRRIAVEIGDVATLIKRYAADATLEKFDAVVLDLYSGPDSGNHKQKDPLYGSTAIETTRAALKPGGMFAVWGEDHDAGFEKRLKSAGFGVTCQRKGRGGPRHVVYLARRKTSPKRN